MVIKGQLVEIPADSPLYTEAKPEFTSALEALRWESRTHQYSLFDGFLVGGHPGVEYFRPGQRRGIEVGGKKAPLYVIGIDTAENRIFVGEGKNHPGLWTKAIAFDSGSINSDKGIIMSEEVLQKGIPVSVQSPSLPTALNATLVAFGAEFFLTADERFPITVKDEDLTLYHRNQPIATIKINNINLL